MSKISVLKYNAEDQYSCSITKVLIVSRNTKQLTDLAKRLSKFAHNEDGFDVVTLENPLIVGDKLAVQTNDDSDINYTFVKDVFDHLKDSEKEDYDWISIANSATNDDMSYAFSYVFGDPSQWKLSEAIKRKIDKAKRNGDYYLNKEKYTKLEWMI